MQPRFGCELFRGDTSNYDRVFVDAFAAELFAEHREKFPAVHNADEKGVI